MQTSGTVVPAVDVLLRSIVDYAGVFPPASLHLASAFAKYAQLRGEAHAWMLGRFVLPDSRLQEFDDLASTLDESTEGPSRHAGFGPWPLSVVLTAPALDRVLRFNQRWRGRAAIAAVEFPPLTRDEIERAAVGIPPGIEPFFELPLDADFASRVAVVAAHGGCVKIRTGGVTAAAFPSATKLVESIRVCAGTRVALKASAGLHHALCGPYALTDEADSPVAQMHGFLNLVVAAVLAYLGHPPEHLAQVLRETSGEAFRFTADGLAWRDRAVAIEELAEARRRFFRSFGSCAFEEPVQDLERLGIIT